VCHATLRPRQAALAGRAWSSFEVTTPYTDFPTSTHGSYNRSQHYLSHGYPAAPPFNGERHWICDSTLATSDNSASPATMGIGCDMTGGSSGGGWIVGSNLYSVNSYGYSNQPNVMYGPYIDSVAQSLYTAASAG
jgi:hypothetical protein